MSRETWNVIKNSKTFYIQTYRRGSKYLIVSGCINLLLCLIIYYLHLHQPERDFYATSGITPPIKLNPLNEPNYTGTALLAPDPTNDDEVKVIPQ